jgi:hypothetical protein
MSADSSNPEQFAELQRLGRVAHLLELRLVGFSASLNEPWPGPEVDVELEIGTELQIHSRAGGFSVVGRFTCRVHQAQETPRKLLATFQYSALCDYETGEEEFPPGLIELYARTNSMVHLWPYFRHFVQTSAVQLAIIPILLPPFRASASDAGWVRGEHKLPLHERGE